MASPPGFRMCAMLVRVVCRYVSTFWPNSLPPHRGGMVGEALFVHAQFILQRASRPDFGLREDVILPWYEELAKQYCARPFGGWQGNRTLLLLHDDMQAALGERRYSGDPTYRCQGRSWKLEDESCQ